ncbi:MAG TPA: hypothetical protein VKT73_00370 [Xanthobacteraceae bacterium]|nr:hypothetical protein [Xanthobacteraceae bacterium]
MNFHPRHGTAAIEPSVPVPIGLPALAKLAFDGCDLAPVWNQLVHRVTADPLDAAAYMDLSTIAHLQGRPEDRIALQSEALRLQRIYRQPSAIDGPHSLRLLAFMAPGDFMANIPIEFLLEGSSVRLDMVYVLPGAGLPELPDHDLAFVAMAETDPNQILLRGLEDILRSWQRPVVNAPAKIARLTRDGTWELLKSAPGLTVPRNARIDRPSLARIGGGDAAIEEFLPDSSFPVIARPLDSHAGNGLAKLDDRAAIASYLQQRPEAEFYIAPFIDYRGSDGFFRKYRVVLIGGRPYASHMAISSEWMIHYLNAGMMESAWKRDEEARFMADFDRDFSVRHAVALTAIADRFGLEYIPFDCGETRDGKLLFFESGTNMIVHSMDSPDLFPYKKPQMEKLFSAFRNMLKDAGARGR